jgi:chromosome segregation ATPase
VVYLD